ncbi:MAG: flagellar export protein FliJ [Hyphomicrobiales bacterium]|nr:flagellar export protein FliJ [Hyphomicrobiales bacterium]
MRSKDLLLRLRRFDLGEKRQTVADLEIMIVDFTRMADDLARQIDLEEQRCGVRDPSHFAYPTFAKSAQQRRQNLLASIARLEARLDAARAELSDALAEMNKSDPSDRCDASSGYGLVTA